MRLAYMKKLFSLLILGIAAILISPDIHAQELGKEIKIENNYLVVTDTATSVVEFEYPKNAVRCQIDGSKVYFYAFDKGGDVYNIKVIRLVNESDTPYSIATLRTWLYQYTGDFKTGGSTPLPTSVTLIHSLMIGASQSGGYNSDPSLTSTGLDSVYTLTDGPLAPDVDGTFITLVEGDTYNQDAVPQTYTDVETAASGLGHSLYNLITENQDESQYRVCVTHHYRGGTSLQQLSKDGTQAEFGFNEAVASIKRVKELCDSLGWNYLPQLNVWVSGSGANPITDALDEIITDFRDTIPTYYSGTLKALILQPRVTGSPDFGPQCYEYTLTDSNSKVIGPVRDFVLSGEVQGDGIHLTNHGERRVGIYYGYAIYEDIFGSGYGPLELDSANVFYDAANTRIGIPTINADGVLQGTGDYNIVLYDVTNSATMSGTWSTSNDTLYFTMSFPGQTGDTEIEIRAGQGTGTLTDSRSNADVIYNAGDSNPYDIYKPLVRYTYTATVPFPDFTTLDNTYQINLTKTSTSVSGWINFYGDEGPYMFINSETWTVGDGITLVNAGSGWLPGGTNGTSTGDDSGAYPDDVLDEYWAGSGGAGDWLEFRGLDRNKRYEIDFLAARAAAGNPTRTHDYSVVGATTQDQLNNSDLNDYNVSDNTSNVANVTKMQPDSNGYIRITDTPVGDTFWRMNAIVLRVYSY